MYVRKSLEVSGRNFASPQRINLRASAEINKTTTDPIKDPENNSQNVSKNLTPLRAVCNKASPITANYQQ
jgi:hypothetical protein